MAVKLILRGFSLYGKKIMEALKIGESALSERCSWPPGQDYSVEINELPGRRLEMVVIPCDSRSIGLSFHRVFGRRTNVKQIVATIVRAVAAAPTYPGIVHPGREHLEGRVLNFPQRHRDLASADTAIDLPMTGEKL